MRLHLFEWEDLEWFPGLLRDNMTDFLRNVILWHKIYNPAINILTDILTQSNHKTVIDLCSGAGGGIEDIVKKINSTQKIKFILTDKFPNEEAIKHFQNKELIEYLNYPVDARSISPELAGVRTLFSSFHHFKPADARRILQDAVNKNMPIAIFEGAGKTIYEFLMFLISFPIIIFIITPFIKPFKWSRLIYTYLIPLLPLFIYWDGLVSILRMYSQKDLIKLTKSFENSYNWKAGILKGNITKITYLAGIPNDLSRNIVFSMC